MKDRKDIGKDASCQDLFMPVLYARKQDPE